MRRIKLTGMPLSLPLPCIPRIARGDPYFRFTSTGKSFNVLPLFQAMALRRVFVAGGASTPFIGRGSPDFIGPKHDEYGKRSNPTLEQLLQQAVHSAFEHSRVLPDRCVCKQQRAARAINIASSCVSVCNGVTSAISSASCSASRATWARR